MKYKAMLFLGLVLLTAFYRVSAAEAIAVVTALASPHNKLTVDTLKLVYLRKIQVDEHGQRWIPVNLPQTDPLRKDFSLALFATLPEDLEDYWNDQYFHGITPPPVMSSEEAVLRFVSSTPGSVGYVRQSHLDARVKVILLLHTGTER